MPIIRNNFITLMIILSLESYSTYSLSYLMKSIEGNMFDNTMASQLSEVVADLASGVLFFCVGARKGFILSFFVSILGFVFLLQAILCGFPDKIPFFISLAKFGISSAFNITYIGSVKLIPTLFAASVFGFSNVVARTVTIFAPVVAEIEGTFPICINIMFMVIAFITSFFVQVKLPKFY